MLDIFLITWFNIFHIPLKLPFLLCNVNFFLGNPNINMLFLYVWHLFFSLSFFKKYSVNSILILADVSIPLVIHGPCFVFDQFCVVLQDNFYCTMPWISLENCHMLCWYHSPHKPHPSSVLVINFKCIHLFFFTLALLDITLFFIQSYISGCLCCYIGAHSMLFYTLFLNISNNVAVYEVI